MNGDTSELERKCYCTFTPQLSWKAGATRNRQSSLNHLAYDMPYLYIFFFFPVIAALIHFYQDPGVWAVHTLRKVQHYYKTGCAVCTTVCRQLTYPCEAARVRDGSLVYGAPVGCRPLGTAACAKFGPCLGRWCWSLD